MSCLESGCIMISLLLTVPNFDVEDFGQKFEKRKLNASPISYLRRSILIFCRCGIQSLVATHLEHT